MFRLYPKAFNILVKEIEIAASKDELAGEVARDIALKRLHKLRLQKGTPVTEKEIKELFQDIFPEFSDRAIKQAAKANRPPSKLWLLPKLTLGITALSGVIWVINLPYPMIRRPVAKIAPILLLPSYLSMDYNYRKAIAKVEQADRLVNQATSLADLELGKEKVKQAQKHLDKLPVWFLGYQPQVYMTLFRFSWFFTLDEFKKARGDIGRMEAVVFQETNAMQQLASAESTIKQAKQDYQQASDAQGQQNAVATWQAGIDELNQLPRDTLAYDRGQAKLVAYNRDFETVSGLIAGNSLTNTLISSAKISSRGAISACENEFNSAEQWQYCLDLWQDAIADLQEIPIDDPGYLNAKELIVQYKSQSLSLEERKQQEIKSVRALENAESILNRLSTQVDNNNRDYVRKQIKEILLELRKVRAGTTVYQEAQELIVAAENKLREIN